MKCKIELCQKDAHTKGLCVGHYSRLWRTGDAGNEALKSKAPRGSAFFLDSNGYRRININNDYVLEHRYIIEKSLGRKLLPEENIHHKNGDRLDNKIENLEVWNTSQPKGQRVEDKIKWAKEILLQYSDLQSEDDAHYW